MRYFSWDPEKNEKLKAERNISFEEIVFYIERGQVLDILEHPSKEPRPQGGALKPKFLKPKTEIPKSIDPESSSGPGLG